MPLITTLPGQINMQSLKIRSAPSNQSSHPLNRTAFTLVEMLVVIAIIGILVGLLFPALSAVRQAARRSYCSANMRQVILATLTYETSRLTFPAGDNGQGGSYMIAILPYLKQEYLVELEQDALQPGETYADRMREMTELELEFLECPASAPEDNRTNVANTGDFTTHYYGIAGPTGQGRASDDSHVYNYQEFSSVGPEGAIGLQGLFSPNKQGRFEERKLTQIKDGASYTFGFGEISGFDQHTGAIKKAGWAFGTEYRNNKPLITYGIKSVAFNINSNEGGINDLSFSSAHPSGAQFALIDGAIRFVDRRIGVDILKTFCSIDEVEKPEKLDGSF